MIIESVHFFLSSSWNTDNSLSVLFSSLRDQRVSLYKLDLFPEHTVSLSPKMNPKSVRFPWSFRLTDFQIPGHLCLRIAGESRSQCEDSGIFKSLRFLSFNSSLLSFFFPFFFVTFPLSLKLFLCVRRNLTPIYFHFHIFLACTAIIAPISWGSSYSSFHNKFARGSVSDLSSFANILRTIAYFLRNSVEITRAGGALMLHVQSASICFFCWLT